jgi:hypothetical protein
VTLAQLLNVERLGNGAFRERAGTALEPFLRAARTLKPGVTQGAFFDCIRLALPAALDVSLAEVVAAGWRRHGAAPSGLCIRSTHRSVVDVRAGERLLACIDVRAEVTLALAPLGFDPADNAILTDRDACAGGALYCAGELLLEEPYRPVAMPARISAP